MVFAKASLVGKIVSSGCLKARVSASGVLAGSLSKPIGYTDYVGDYEVTPKTSEQTLRTKDKHLTEDVTIKSIPYFETSNNSGGNTIYIASDLIPDEPDIPVISDESSIIAILGFAKLGELQLGCGSSIEPDIPIIPEESNITAILGIAKLGELQLGSN